MRHAGAGTAWGASSAGREARAPTFDAGLHALAGRVAPARAQPAGVLWTAPAVRHGCKGCNMQREHGALCAPAPSTKCTSSPCCARCLAAPKPAAGQRVQGAHVGERPGRTPAGIPAQPAPTTTTFFPLAAGCPGACLAACALALLRCPCTLPHSLQPARRVCAPGGRAMAVPGLSADTQLVWAVRTQGQLSQLGPSAVRRWIAAGSEALQCGLRRALMTLDAPVALDAGPAPGGPAPAADGGATQRERMNAGAAGSRSRLPGLRSAPACGWRARRAPLLRSARPRAGAGARQSTHHCAQVQRDHRCGWAPGSRPAPARAERRELRVRRGAAGGTIRPAARAAAAEARPGRPTAGGGGLTSVAHSPARCTAVPHPHEAATHAAAVRVRLWVEHEVGQGGEPRPSWALRLPWGPLCSCRRMQVYINFNACFLDCNVIEIGDHTLFGARERLAVSYAHAQPGGPA